MSKLVNLTPHEITLRGADDSVGCDYHGRVWEAACGECVAASQETDVIIPPSGQVARVATRPGGWAGVVHAGGVGVPVFAPPTMGEVEGLPDPVEGTIYIVSSMVAAQCRDRMDVVSPGTGPDDHPVREAGKIVAVRRLIWSADRPWAHQHAMNANIRALRNEAIKAGYLRMEMICRLALDPRALDGAEDGTVAALLLKEEWTQDEARAECERLIEAGPG